MSATVCLVVGALERRLSGHLRFLTGGGFKATGGTISPGNAYVVGERGPEIISGSAGTVMSNTQSNNAVTKSALNGA